jgi:hypothetical protein
VLPGRRRQLCPEAPRDQDAAINATLGLVNAPDCCRAREEYVTCYLNREIRYDYLYRRAPLVAQELRRQGELLPEDR